MVRDRKIKNTIDSGNKTFVRFYFWSIVSHWTHPLKKRQKCMSWSITLQSSENKNILTFIKYDRRSDFLENLVGYFFGQFNSLLGLLSVRNLRALEVPFQAQFYRTSIKYYIFYNKYDDYESYWSSFCFCSQPDTFYWCPGNNEPPSIIKSSLGAPNPEFRIKYDKFLIDMTVSDHIFYFLSMTKHWLPLGSALGPNGASTSDLECVSPFSEKIWHVFKKYDISQNWIEASKIASTNF